MYLDKSEREERRERVCESERKKERDIQEGKIKREMPREHFTFSERKEN